LLFYVVSGFGTAFGAIWCIPDAGDHALRAPLGACCAPCRDACPAPPAATVTAEACGQCVDVELRFPSLQSRNRPPAQPPATPVTGSTAVAARAQPAPTGIGINLECAKGPRLAQRHLDTVVLII